MVSCFVIGCSHGKAPRTCKFFRFPVKKLAKWGRLCRWIFKYNAFTVILFVRTPLYPQVVRAFFNIKTILSEIVISSSKIVAREFQRIIFVRNLTSSFCHQLSSFCIVDARIKNLTMNHHGFAVVTLKVG